MFTLMCDIFIMCFALSEIFPLEEEEECRRILLEAEENRRIFLEVEEEEEVDVRFHVYICNVSSYCLFSKMRMTFRTISRFARNKMIYLSKCSLIYLHYFLPKSSC